MAECWIGGKWEDSGLMWWFGGEREERDEGAEQRLYSSHAFVDHNATGHMLTVDRLNSVQLNRYK